MLRLLGKDPDPATSREHVLLSVLAERPMQHFHAVSLEPRDMRHALAGRDQVVVNPTMEFDDDGTLTLNCEPEIDVRSDKFVEQLRAALEIA